MDEKLKELYQQEVKKVREILEQDSFDMRTALIESAHTLECLILLQKVLGSEEELDSIGADAPQATIEDFLRCVNEGDMQSATSAIGHVLGVAPDIANHCMQNFAYKWQTDTTTYDKVKRFVSTQNPNEYHWLLYELFGVTGISNGPRNG